MQLEKLTIPENDAVSKKLADRPATPLSYMAMNHHPNLLEASLIAALEWLAHDFQKKNSLPFDFSYNTPSRPAEPYLKIGLFHIAQEACDNISKHAHASTVSMYLHHADEMLQLEIIDNGCGMDMQQQCGTLSAGLERMKEQATLMGGELTIASAKEKGTIIRVSVPFIPLPD